MFDGMAAEGNAKFQPSRCSELKAAMTIFLVEDDPKIRSFLIPLINSACDGPVIGYAETELEALDWLHDHHGWTLAVLDVMLREGSGINVLAQCQNRKLGQAVVMLTNSATPEIRTKAAEFGANAIFDKTVELEQFLEFCSSRKSSGNTAVS
jgi:two-component system OmpR family response regulator